MKAQMKAAMPKKGKAMSEEDAKDKLTEYAMKGAMKKAAKTKMAKSAGDKVQMADKAKWDKRNAAKKSVDRKTAIVKKLGDTQI